MQDYEVRIRTKFGELIFHFSDKADLEKKLAPMSEFATTVEQSIWPILAKELVKVIQGLEDIYAIEPDGTIKLLKYPMEKAEVLRLASFLSSTPLTVAQLKKITGVDNPKAYMSSKDFTENPDGTYALSTGARADVANKTIPSLKSKRAP
jgi:hypothetical protein